MSRLAQTLNRAAELVRAGRHADARALLLRVAPSAPNDPALNGLLCYVLAMTGELDRSAYYGERAVAVRPQAPDLRLNLGSTLMELGRAEEAATHFQAALALRPDHELLVDHLSAAWTAAGRFIDAERLLEQHAARWPDSSRLAARRADVLVACGRSGEAVQRLRDACAKHPDDPSLASDLCTAAAYDPSLSAAQAFEPARAFGDLVRRRVPTRGMPRAPEFNPDKPLLVGFISPDLRSHAVATFLEPILQHLNHDALRPIVFATSRREDAVTARLRALVPTWRVVDRPSPEELARVVANDAPDVLFDLSGHSAGHALAAFQSRLAPVQITYLGWPASTGVPEMDYRLTDSLADPPADESTHSERLLRVDPCALCYAPHPDAPPVLPAEPSRPPAFGSFNALSKINERVLALWARILREAPEARLVLKHTAYAHEQGRDVARARASAAGIDSARLVLLPPTSHVEHLRAYHEIDVALDTFPFNGATTTCDALHMGVPVLTLPGRTSASRVASSILHAAGCGEWVAGDEDEYAAKAVALLRDEARRRELRTTLRERVLRSPLCDGAGFARRFENAVRAAWRDRCECN